MINVDLITKSMTDGSRILIENGQPRNGYKIPDINVTFDMLDKLYSIYKTSVPDGIHYKYNYFKVNTDKDFDVFALAAGAIRKDAKEKLETTLLFGILNGSLKWPNAAHWFWQSAKDKDFIILKEWMSQPKSV